MNKRTVFWTIFPVFGILFVLFFLAFIFYSIRVSQSFFLENQRNNLQNIAKLVARNGVAAPASWDDFCKAKNELTSLRVTVIDQGGVVLGDSHEDFARMDNHAERPEVFSAMNSGFGHSVRFSNTLHTKMMYVALAGPSDGVPLVFRVAIPLTALEETLEASQKKVLGAGLLGVFLVLAFSLVFARSISHPIEKLRHSALRIASGEMDSSVMVEGTREINDLAAALNQMRGSLKNRIETIQKQQTELDAIFKGMNEGVLALNTQLELLTCNPKASLLFGIDLNRSLHTPVYQFLRNSKLIDFIHKILAVKTTQSTELEWHREGERLALKVSGTPLFESGPKLQGVILVVSDLTHLRQLETIREEFVANVSHELKTPITAIKGASETLEDGAWKNAQLAPKFLKMITDNSNRLARLVEDIMQLARLEGEMKTEELEKSLLDARQILRSALANCEGLREEKNIQVTTVAKEGLQFQGNGLLIEQALINLLQNAIKYSPENTTIEMAALREDNYIRLQVKDQGMGIPAIHLSRLFERFYRVDKARSRKMGGTGLGLAIVKHTCQLHNGTVEVTSEVGVGSTFWMRLPV